MRFPSDDELMAGPNAFGDARIEVAPDAADPEADARAQIDAGLGEETADEAGAQPGDDEDFDDSEEDEEEYEDLEELEDEEDADLDARVAEGVGAGHEFVGGGESHVSCPCRRRG